MSLISRMRRQKAVWWERDSTPDEFGKFGFSAPLELDCRWEDKPQEFVTVNGETLISRAVVYVDRNLSVGDRLKLSTLNFDIPNDPSQTADTFEVMSFQSIPNLRATENLLVAYLR